MKDNIAAGGFCLLFAVWAILAYNPLRADIHTNALNVTLPAVATWRAIDSFFPLAWAFLILVFVALAAYVLMKD